MITAKIKHITPPAKALATQVIRQTRTVSTSSTGGMTIDQADARYRRLGVPLSVSDVTGLQSALDDKVSSSATRTARTFYSAPASVDGVATWRTIASSDLPDSGAVAGSYGSSSQTLTVSVDSKGRATSVAAVAIAIAVSQVSGLQSTLDSKLATVTADTTSRAANTVYAAPNGSAGTATFRALVAADIPSLDTSKLTSGTLGYTRGGTGLTAPGATAGNLRWSGSAYAIDTAVYALASAIPAASSTTPAALGTAAVGTGTTWARADHVHAMPTAAQVGAVSSVGLTAPALMTASGSPVTGSGTLALAWSGSSANLVRADGSTVASSSFQAAGSYLPLAAGSGSPLTGALYAPQYRVNVDGDGIWLFDSTRIYKAVAGGLRLRSNSGNVRPMFEDSTGAAYTIWDSGNLTLAAIGAQPAGSYQPLENQRLSTTNLVTFADVTSTGGATLGGWLVTPYGRLREYAGGATYQGFYPSGVAPDNNNFSVLWHSSNAQTYLNATSGVYLQIFDGTTRNDRLIVKNTAIDIYANTNIYARSLVVGATGNAAAIEFKRGSDGSSASFIGHGAATGSDSEFRYQVSGGSAYHSWYTNNGTNTAERMRLSAAGNLTLNGDLSATTANSSKFRVNSSATDLVSNAPWYGLGYSDVASSAGYMVQLAGYWGLRLRTGSNILDIPGVAGNATYSGGLTLSGRPLQVGSSSNAGLVSLVNGSGSVTGMLGYVASSTETSELRTSSLGSGAWMSWHTNTGEKMRLVEDGTFTHYGNVSLSGTYRLTAPHLTIGFAQFSTYSITGGSGHGAGILESNRYASDSPRIGLYSSFSGNANTVGVCNESADFGLKISQTGSSYSTRTFDLLGITNQVFASSEITASGTIGALSSYSVRSGTDLTLTLPTPVGGKMLILNVISSSASGHLITPASGCSIYWSTTSGAVRSSNSSNSPNACRIIRGLYILMPISSTEWIASGVFI